MAIGVVGYVVGAPDGIGGSVGIGARSLEREGRWRSIAGLLAILAVVAWCAPVQAQPKKIEYCANNVDAPSPTNRCFDTLGAAEAFLRQEPVPAIGRKYLQPTSTSPALYGDYTIRYSVPPRAPERLFGSWYWSVPVNGGGGWGRADCDTRVPISSVVAYGCDSEESLKADMLNSYPYGPTWSGSYRGEYPPMPPSSWNVVGEDSATGRSFVSVVRTENGFDGREFVATSGDQTYYSAVQRTDYHMCPKYFMGSYSGSGTRWPQVCVINKTGEISVVSRQYDSCTKNGNPCVAATGNKEYRETDFDWDGLSFARAYNSIRDIQTMSGMGGNWAHTFSDRIIDSNCTGDTCMRTWMRSDGYYEQFQFVSGNAFKSPSRPGVVLYRESDPVAAVSGRWRMALGNGKQLRFADNGSLLRIEQGQRSYDLKYCTDAEFQAGICAVRGALNRVVSDTGRILEFEYGQVTVPVGSEPDETRTDTVISRIKTGAKVLAEYGYDAKGRLIGASFPVGQGEQGRSYIYAEPAHLCRDAADQPVAQCDPADFSDYMTGVMDEAGKRIATYSYGRYGRVTRSEHADGIGRVTSDYKDTGDVEVTLPGGAKKTYQFVETPFRKPSEILLSATDGSVAERITRNYDWMWLTSSIDGRRNRTNYAYNGLQETSRIEGLSEGGSATAFTRTVRTDWNPNFNEVASRRVYDASNALKSQQDFVYNDRGQVLTATQVDPATNATRTTTYAYCEAADVAAAVCPVVGRLRSMDGPRSDVADVTSFVYYQNDDPACVGSSAPCAYRKGDLWKLQDALGHVTEYLGYDGMGRPAATRDANGVRTDIEYDDRGRVLATKQRGANDAVETDDRITRMEYWPTGRVKKVVLPDGVTTTYGYDVDNRLVRIEDAQGNSIRYTLDASGNRLKEDTHASDGTLKRTLSRVYNQLDQLQANKDASQNATVYRYDAGGNQDRTTDALGRITDQGYDPLDRLVRTLQDVGGLNVETKFEHDALDRLTKVTDPKGLDTTYVYNGFGEQTRLTSPDTGITNYTYNAAGKVATKQDANDPEPHRYTYDALNRPKAVFYTAAGAADVEYDYDTVNSVCAVGETFAIGRVAAMRADGTELKYCYDRFGQVVRKVQIVAGKSFTLRYAYTLAGNLQAITYPDGTVVDYVRDAQARVKEIGVQPSGGTRTTLLSNATYEPSGPVSEWTYGNGRKLSRTYDLDYRAKTILDNASGGLSLSYGYNTVGEMTELKDGLQSSVQAKYDYDTLGRLTVTRDGSSNPLETYTYDETGNRKSLLHGGITDTYVYPTTSHRLSSVAGVARGYDAVGNTVSIGGAAKEFVYNADDRLSQFKQAGVVKAGYRYNAIGQRVAAVPSAGAVETFTLYDEAGNWIGDYDGAGVAKQQAVWFGDFPVGLAEGSGSGQSLVYVQPDRLGTPRAIVDPTRNAAIWTWNAKSEVFGSTPPNQDSDLDGIALVFNMRFSGQQYDARAGLAYNYLRDYEAETGRYIQSDPVGLSFDPSTYAYVRANPVSYVDPYGLWRISLTGFYPTPYIIGPGGGLNISGEGFKIESFGGRFGFGIGGGLSIDPVGKPQDSAACAGANSIGLYAEAGGSWGPLGLGAGWNYGGTQTMGADGRPLWNEYGGLKEKSNLKWKTTFGVGVSGSAGIEMVHYFGRAQ